MEHHMSSSDYSICNPNQIAEGSRDFSQCTYSYFSSEIKRAQIIRIKDILDDLHNLLSIFSKLTFDPPQAHHYTLLLPFNRDIPFI